MTQEDKYEILFGKRPGAELSVLGMYERRILAGLLKWEMSLDSEKRLLCLQREALSKGPCLVDKEGQL